MRKTPITCIVILLLFSSHALFPQEIMKKVDLGGKWKFRKAGTSQWMDAKVPGCVHTDLMKNGVIPDPFLRDNEKNLQWISDIGWEYEKTFTVSDTLFRFRNLELVCKGLDTYANVYLNDSLIIVADNMFRDWYADIRLKLVIGVNKLRIQFPAVTSENKARYSRLKHKLPGDEKVVCRKAAYQFGWDWGPVLITSGIWRPIYIRCWDYLNVLGVQYIQRDLTDSVADMTAVFTFKARVSDSALIKLSVNGKLLATKKVPAQSGVNYARVDFRIANPKRWWPNGLGEPYLYPIRHQIYFAGKFAAEGTEKLGLRTVELHEDADKAGTSFHFVVNGIPVFMKGANYIPQDNFPSRVTDSSYRALIASVKASKMNMLRVWGGGIYENDIFYDLCDENGILVWQDFMFACALYPDNKDFIRNIQAEAAQNVVRLRNHPCIALWCGNNEIDEGWKNWGWQKQYGYSSRDSAEVWNNYRGIFGGTLLSVIAKFDSLRPYIHSSPRFGWGRPESTKQGDMHYWGVWWGKEPFSAYKEKTGRFMSEYGFQGFPSLETIQKFTLPSDRQLGSPVMKAHQKHPVGYETIDEYLLRDYRRPGDFESYVYVSQLLQAEGIKTAIEAHRRAMPYCMGTLYWQLNDCWPVVSWSSRDYYGNEKALHYFLKNEYNTLLVSPVINKGRLSVFVISDSLTDCHPELHLSLRNFAGKTFFDTTLTIYVAPNSSSPFVEFDTVEMLKGKDPKQLIFGVQLSFGKKIISQNNLYFEKVRDLILEKPVITKTLIKSQEGYQITISSDRLAKNVYLTCGLKGSFSANFFDLMPGENRTVTFSTRDNKTPIDNKLKIITLADTY
ncbi:MAG: glycoside hydrolase family 2 protein [Bacteroidetes bacterium]|nr:glycoside hydrolase family 2 protein [Bacteroidota bacterium]